MQPRQHRNYDVYREPARSLRRSVAPRTSGRSIDGIKPKPSALSQNLASLRLAERPIQKPLITKPASHAQSHTIKPTISSPAATHFNRRAIAFSVMALVIFVTGGTVSYMNWRTNKQVAAWVNNQAESEDDSADGASSESEIPDETEPKGSPNAYKVAADLPRMLLIGEIKVSARIKPLGVNNNNELKAPSNIYDVGWYEGSSKPGLGGTTLLDGHVHGPTKPGVFFNLKNLKEGSIIELERGDGQKFSYKVVKTKKYAAKNVDMAAALTPVVPGKEGLNLITCAGSLNKKTNSYEDRLVIFATLVD